MSWGGVGWGGAVGQTKPDCTCFGASLFQVHLHLHIYFMLHRSSSLALAVSHVSSLLLFVSIFDPEPRMFRKHFKCSHVRHLRLFANFVIFSQTKKVVSTLQFCALACKMHIVPCEPQKK